MSSTKTFPFHVAAQSCCCW